MNPLIAIVGPTATGKTRLAVYLAQRFSGEIINADSRQIYRCMDIITAKPGKAETSAIKHHLIDIVEPDEDFSLATYQKMAINCIEDVHKRGKIPFLVGGSGLYIWSVLEGWQIPEVEPDPDFRQKLYFMAEQEGTKVLYDDLMQKDPQAAEKILPDNLRRIVRALEIFHATGKQASQMSVKIAPLYPIFITGLTAPRDELYRMIDLRVDEMVQKGMVEEVKCLMDKGYNLQLSSMSGIGYRQIALYLEGKLTLTEALQKIKYETHRFVRKQYAWFHLDDPRIHWFDICSDYQWEVSELVHEFLVKNT